VSTFVLVHGAWHGAWCWERLIPELAKLGQGAITMDLPASDGAATFDTYARAVVDAIPHDADDLVLVGHSLGGMVLPLIAQARPARAMAFVCAIVPKVGGFPWEEELVMDPPGAYEPLTKHDDGSTTWPTVETAAAAMYHDCSWEDASWAFAHLRAQNSKSLWAAPYPLDRMPAVGCVSVLGADDRAINPNWSRFVARERLGVVPIELPGSHSPFIARPAQLAAVLARAVKA
jgi:pimeloyl-ACP methyl ester carboxylesterase